MKYTWLINYVVKERTSLYDRKVSTIDAGVSTGYYAVETDGKVLSIEKLGEITDELELGYANDYGLSVKEFNKHYSLLISRVQKMF